MGRNAVFVLLALVFSHANAKNLREGEAGSSVAALKMYKNEKERLRAIRQLPKGEKTAAPTLAPSAQSNVTTNVTVELFTVAEILEAESWPKCVGMTVDSCKQYILNTTTQPVEFQEMLPTDIAIKNYLWERVRIYHDESSPQPLVVEPAPGRG